MNYASQDQIAAIGDLIAFDGELISVNGQNVRAHVERGGISAEASEFGLDNRDQEVTATVVTRGMPLIDFDSPVKVRGSSYRITAINPAGDYISTLTLENK